MSTDDLNTTIDALTQALTPVKKCAHPYVSASFVFTLTLIYGAVMVFYIGLRPDLPEKWGSMFFVTGIFSALGLYITSAIAAAWLCRPDTHGRTWLPLIPIGFAGFLASVTFVQALQQGLHFPLPHWDHCFTDGTLMSSIPAAALMFMTMNGHTTRPRMMATMVILAVIALSYIGLRFTCMMDTVGHSFFYHIFPATIFGAVIGMLARRLFRW